MCNECGNCKSFCPYDSAPYLDKFTLFMDENDMADSKNQGFTVLDKDAVHCKVRFCGEILDWTLGEETKDSGSTSESNGDCLQGLHISVKIIAEGLCEIAPVEIE